MQPGAPLLSAWRRSAGATPFSTLTPRAAGLLEKPFSIARIESRLVQQLSTESRVGEQAVLVVDMDWLLQAPSAMANGAIWGTIIERLFGAGALGCLSLYHRRHLPERDLLAGLHVHAAVLAPDGCRANPYQLPLDLAVNAGSAQTADGPGAIRGLRKAHRRVGARDARKAWPAAQGLNMCPAGNEVDDLRRHARDDPDRPAVACGDHRLSYGELEALANCIAAVLRARGLWRRVTAGTPAASAPCLAQLAAGARHTDRRPAGDRTTPVRRRPGV